MLAHALLYDRLFAGRKNFVDMRRHFKAYVGGFPGARRLRMELMETRSVADVERVVDPVIGAESVRRARDRAHALASAEAWATRPNGAAELTVKTAG